MKRVTSSDNFPEASCEGKNTFTSYTAAAKIAHLCSNRKDVRCRPYKCNHCGKYHFGQSDRPKGKMHER